jgi:hypothetical protein
MTSRITFRRQYKPVGFGDPPDPRTVDGMRLSRRRAAETARFNRMREEEEQGARASNPRLSWLEALLDWCFSYMKFPTWKGR